MKIQAAILLLVLLSTPSLAAEKREKHFPCWQVKTAAAIYGAANLETWARTRYSEAAIREAKKCLSRTSSLTDRTHL